MPQDLRRGRWTLSTSKFRFWADCCRPAVAKEGPVSAPLRRWLSRSALTALDPELLFEIGPMNGRYAQESGLWPKASGRRRRTLSSDALIATHRKPLESRTRRF